MARHRARVTPYGTPNLAVLDQIAALRWVQDNISKFGGNPARVTLAGESAGAMAVGGLLVTPAATGLFSSAIMQSGGAENLLSLSDGRTVTEQVTAAAGVAPTTAALRDVPAEDLVRATATVAAAAQANPDPAIWGTLATRGTPFAPVIDGEIIPRAALEALRAGANSRIPLLIGTDRDEERLFLVPSGVVARVDLDGLFTAAAKYGLSREGMEVYRSSRPTASPGDVFAAIATDYRWRIPTLHLAEARRSASAPTWVYRFDALERDANGGLAVAVWRRGSRWRRIAPGRDQADGAAPGAMTCFERRNIGPPAAQPG